MSLAEALDLAVERVSRLRPVEGRLPHVTGEDGLWGRLSPTGEERGALTGLPWTGGFVAGQLWLASTLPGRGDLAAEAARVTDLLAPRATQPTTHDLGFLFWPSAVLGHLLTGEARYRDLGLQAAAALAERALPSGVVQVIGRLDDRDLRGRTIVDTWPNLTLLWWAERQGLAGAGATARRHLEATAALLRPDGSTFHAGRFADHGAVRELGTANGRSDGSTWARGQAWAVHGLVAASRATRDAALLAQAERAAGWFLDHLPVDLVPPWDFDDPEGPRDASAAAIVASALLDLGRRDDASRLLEALVGSCLNRSAGDGLLLHCCYRRRIGLGLDAATAWGDFFLLDALLHAVEPELRPDPLA